MIGNNIVNIALASIGTLVFVDIWGHSGATISTIVITIVVLIFGEITPKSVAKDIPEQFAMFSASLYQSVNDPFDAAYLPFRKMEAFNQQAF